MSWFDTRNLPVAKYKHYTFTARGSSNISEYVSLGKPFLLNAIKLVLSAAHPSAEHMRAYLQYSWLSFDIKFFSTEALNGSYVHIYTAEASKIMLHTYDKIFFSMILSGTATNWNLMVDGWSIIE